MDSNDPATWAPAMVSVGIVGLVLVILAAMAYSVAKKLRLMDERLVSAEVERNKKRRPKKKERVKALHDIQDRRAQITRYHRAGGLLLVGAFAAVAADIVMSLMVLADPVVFGVAAAAAVGVGALLYLGLTRPPKFEPIPEDFA